MAKTDMNYVINNGKRELDHNSKVQRQIEYLSPSLYPLGVKSETVLKLGQLLRKKMEASNLGTLTQPFIVVCKNNIHKAIFALLLLMVNNKEVGKFVRYKVIDIEDARQDYLKDSMDYSDADVLFVKLNYSEIPHMYNAYCIRNLAQLRLEQGKYTFFYFWGTKSQLESNKWKLDEQGDGASNANRILTPITHYVSYIDLNKDIEKEGGKNA